MKNLKIQNLIIIMATLFSACASRSESFGNKAADSRDTIYSILHYASLAGSSHNSQPWKTVVYGKDSIEVLADTSRSLPVVDPDMKELCISIGAFIENLSVAANCYGYNTSIRIHSLPVVSDSPVATILLTKMPVTCQNALLKEIELRTTLRIPFDTLSIKPSDWMKLNSVDKDNIHYFPAASEKGRFIKQKELEAYTQQTGNKQVLDELASWIRFSDKDVNLKRDGLTTRGMGIKGIGGFVVRNFFKPEDSKKESFVIKGIDKTKLLVENCGGWIVITQKSETLESWISTGRLYQSVQLKCRNLSIGFHPMNQILEEPLFKKEANDILIPGDKIMFVARVGYVKEYPKPVSLRRPVESFTTFK